MTTVVTGASGFVGGHLVRALLAAGRQVRAPLHLEEERRWLDGLDVEIVKADVRDLDSLRKAFAGAEVVYHLASYISIQMRDPLLEAINVGGARNVAQACLDAGVRRLVHFSSFHAIQQEPFNAPVTEASPLVTSPRNPEYDRTKAAGEMAIRAAVERGLDAVIVSPTGIIGPLDLRPSYTGSFLRDLAQGSFSTIVAGGCDWVDVRDVVDGAMRAERQAPTGEKYLLSGQYVTVAAMAAQVAAVAGVPAPTRVVPMGLAYAVAPVAATLARLSGAMPRFTRAALNELRGNTRILHDKAARELGYQPRPFADSIRDVVAWLVESGRLPAPVRAAGPTAH